MAPILVKVTLMCESMDIASDDCSSSGLSRMARRNSSGSYEDATHIACLPSALKKFPSSTISGNHTDHYLNGRFRSNEIEPIVRGITDTLHELPIPNALAHNKVIAINTDLIMMAANQQARIS
ncbi:hypothetical protein PGT21_013280 [Puccinia graminis f. sp. tritici]|uniref:Uncharacterized protein n=1 Tax=Puccinia graminis f. sp. tritici TaxID=56615 RepID=A0A5B0R0M8_PUCGR|nr:hypothetical protein PGT21_013280 [Puccinia graminis f. sp. tritici]